MSRWGKWANRVGTPLFVIGAIGGGFKLLQDHGAAVDSRTTQRPAPPPVAVAVSPVTPRPVQRTVHVVGSLFGRDEIVIVPKVDGRIVRIARDVGEAVRPGDVLMELDPTDYQLAVAEAKRALELELSKLGQKTLPEENFDLKVLPSVAKAAAKTRDASAHFERLNTLYARGSISITERDAAERDQRVAKAEYDQAMLDAGATLATARHRQAALDTAEQKLRETRVCVPGATETDAVARVAFKESTATPAEYVVTKREVSQGEYIHAGPGSSVAPFRLVIDRPLKLQVTVPERHKSEIAVGQAVELRVESFPGKVFKGAIARVNPSVDRANRTFQVEVHVPNNDRKLSPGSFVKADILTRTDSAALTVPEEALTSFAGVTKVFVVVDGKTREVQVERGAVVPGVDPTGRRTWVEVRGNLPIGALVATTGQSFLADGIDVRVREEGAKR